MTAERYRPTSGNNSKVMAYDVGQKIDATRLTQPMCGFLLTAYGGVSVMVHDTSVNVDISQAAFRLPPKRLRQPTAVRKGVLHLKTLVFARPVLRQSLSRKGARR